MSKTRLQPKFAKLAAWEAKFLVSAGRGEGAERRVGSLFSNARQNLRQLADRTGLRPIYIWMAENTSRVAALCLNPTGKLFAVELNRAEPVSVAQAWAFSIACRTWADSRQVEDRQAALQWEEMILKSLQVAEPKLRVSPASSASR